MNYPRIASPTVVMAWGTQAIRWHGPSPENPHPITAIFGRERKGL
jgi:hypothetical protein